MKRKLGSYRWKCRGEFLRVTLKLKRYYEEHPVGGEESLTEDTIFRFKQIRTEIDELNVKNLFFIEVGCVQ